MAASDHLFSKCAQRIRPVKNQIIAVQILEVKLKQPGLRNCCLVLFCQMVVVCCAWQAPSPERITVSL